MVLNRIIIILIIKLTIILIIKTKNKTGINRKSQHKLKNNIPLWLPEAVHMTAASLIRVLLQRQRLNLKKINKYWLTH